MHRNRPNPYLAFMTLAVCGGSTFGQSPDSGTAADRTAVTADHTLAPLLHRRKVHAVFDVTTASSMPFPSDQFTVPDPDQVTGRRVKLPVPDCTLRPSDCEDVAVINTLDGFSVNPQVSIPWDGAIDVSTVNSRTVFLIPLYGERPAYRLIGIDQVVWNPEQNRLFVKSAEMLDQHSRYALIATNGIHDCNGAPVEASEAFRKLRREWESM